MNCRVAIVFLKFIIWAIFSIHTFRIHYAHAEANLNSGYSKYAKVARKHYFSIIVLRTPLRAHERSVGCVNKNENFQEICDFKQIQGLEKLINSEMGVLRCD